MDYGNVSLSCSHFSWFETKITCVFLPEFLAHAIVDLEACHFVENQEITNVFVGVKVLGDCVNEILLFLSQFNLLTLGIASDRCCLAFEVGFRPFYELSRVNYFYLFRVQLDFVDLIASEVIDQLSLVLLHCEH